MPYIKPEVIEEAKKMDLFTYLKNFEPYELVKINDNNYCTRTHDSLKISNGLWMWWSRGFGGKTALEYLIKVKGLSFLEAVQTITGCDPSYGKTEYKEVKREEKDVLLPDKSETDNVINKYLISRGIDENIIKSFVDMGLIYESLPYHNIVFLGKDNVGKVRYAAYRATNKSRLMGDCGGSKKEYSFRYVSGKSSTVHLFESAIDLMSYATLIKMQGENWMDMNLISLAGVYQPKKVISESKIPKALDIYLESNDTNKIILHLDNDKAGRMATKALKEKLKDNYEVVDYPPMYGKDFNDFLCIKKGLLRREKERER